VRLPVAAGNRNENGDGEVINGKQSKPTSLALFPIDKKSLITLPPRPVPPFKGGGYADHNVGILLYSLVFIPSVPNFSRCTACPVRVNNPDQPRNDQNGIGNIQGQGAGVRRLP